MINKSVKGCHSPLFCHVCATKLEPTLELKLTLIIELTQFHGWYTSFLPLGFVFTGLLWSFSLLVQGEIKVFACCSCITIHNNPKLNFTWRNSLESKLSPTAPYTFKNKQEIFPFTVAGIHFHCSMLVRKLSFIYFSFILISWTLWPRLQSIVTVNLSPGLSLKITVL